MNIHNGNNFHQNFAILHNSTSFCALQCFETDFKFYIKKVVYGN